MKVESTLRLQQPGRVHSAYSSAGRVHRLGLSQAFYFLVMLTGPMNENSGARRATKRYFSSTRSLQLCPTIRRRGAATQRVHCCKPSFGSSNRAASEWPRTAARERSGQIDCTGCRLDGGKGCLPLWGVHACPYGGSRPRMHVLFFLFYVEWLIAWSRRASAIVEKGVLKLKGCLF